MNRKQRIPEAQRGYTMVELMVAITIALFLLAGLMTLVMHTRSTSATQSQLAQLQDNERIAMTILADVIQQAGYYPDPVNPPASMFQNISVSAGAQASGGSFTLATGQTIGGIGSAAGGPAPGDAIAVRFVSPLKDAANLLPGTIANCAGTSVSDSGSNHTYTNVFQIAQASNGVTYLQCSLYQDGNFLNTYNLVAGLYAMQVWYGVALPGNDNNVATYAPASAFSSGTQWQNVTSVKIRLYFQIPQYGFTGGQIDNAATTNAMNVPTMYIERVIPIMNQTAG